MIINSDYNDYYDFCIKYGQDTRIVYNRKTKSVDNDVLPEDFRIALNKLNNWFTFKGGCRIYNEPIDFYIIGGHAYFVVAATNTILSFEEACNKKNIIFDNNPFTYTRCSELTHNLNCPVLSYVYGNYCVARPRLICNPCLKTNKFPQHAQTVYSQIFNWYQSPEPKIVETDDKYRAIAHGMDNNSFKREPGGPTRKRKKNQL